MPCAGQYSSSSSSKQTPLGCCTLPCVAHPSGALVHSHPCADVHTAVKRAVLSVGTAPFLLLLPVAASC